MSKTQYVCQQCGASFPKWSGQCLNCGAWNSLVEEVVAPPSKNLNRQITNAVDVSLSQLMNQATKDHTRLSTTIKEFDRVLGGGLVNGEVVLLAGSPGIGKSTLLTQSVLGLITKGIQKNHQIVYVAGEENPEQIALRIKRIIKSEHLSLDNIPQGELEEKLNKVKFLTTNQVEGVINYLKKNKPSLVVVDSIQTLVSANLSGAAGSVGQVRASAEKLIEYAKVSKVPLILIGHVTKEGRVAGPMTLEHMVDAVLDFSGDKSTDLRLLRATKNRFGATDEVGVFQLDEFGFRSVANPSELFTSHQDVKKAVGAVFGCVVEGTRPLLVEVQALAVRSYLPTPRRVGRGVDVARLQVLTAVLEKYLKLPLGQYDIFVSIVGGYQTKEPALDLAVAAAIVSSLKNKPMGSRVFVGEVGLLGEVRKVKLFELRKKEVRRLGYKQLVSFQNLKHISQLLKLR